MTEPLYLFQNGSARTTPLVLLHGFPLDGRIWEAVVPRLANYRVVTIDLPGFGKSATISANSMEQFSFALHDVLQTAGLLPCVIAGLSMGGYVAQDFLRRYRGDVLGLILVDTKSAADDPVQRAGRDAMIALVRDKGPTAVVDQMLHKVLGETTHRTRPMVVRRAREIMTAQSAAGIEHALTAMRDRPDYTADLPAIRVPVLIIVGEEDTIATPVTATAMAEKVPGSKRVQIFDAGHFAPLEAPEAFATAVDRWLRETGL